MSVRQVPSASGGAWNLREIVVIAALAVVFGVIYWGLVAAWGAARVAMGPFGDLAQSIFIGGWIVVAPLAIYIIRKPLTGVVTEILAAFVEFAFLGSPIGPLLLLTGLVQGAGAELPFAATGYRRYGWPVFIASGLTAAAFSFVYSAIRFGWFGQTVPEMEAALGGVGVLILIRLVLHLTSGVLLAGVLAKVLGDALKATGVLDNFAIGREPEAMEVTPRARRSGARAMGVFLVAAGVVVFAWAGIQAGDLAVFASGAAETQVPRLLQWFGAAFAVIGAALAAFGFAGGSEPTAAS